MDKQPPQKRMRRACLAACAAAVLLACIASIAPAGAEGQRAEGRIVVLVVDRLSPRDIDPASTPFLAELAERWSVGMMMTRTAERATGKEPDNGADYVTLGAGIRCRGARSAALCFDSDEVIAGADGSTTAGAYKLQSTGVRVPGGGVACLGMPAILKNSEGTGTEESIGLLGECLAARGRRSAVTGNEDSYGDPLRLAPLIVSDPDGVVGEGKVAGLTVEAKREPGGVRTDFAALAAESTSLLEMADVLVIDTGDTGRVDREWATTGGDALDAARRRALRRVDDFAARVAESLDLESSLLLVVSPGAPVEARLDGDYATPIIAAGRGFSRGLLSSGSTRRPGFVNNTDFAPTVLDFFGIGSPAEVTGAPMETVQGSTGGRTNLAYVAALDGQYVVTRQARWPVVVGYLGVLVVFLMLALACLPSIAARLKLERARPRIMKVLVPLSPVLLAMPLSFLLVSAFSFNSWLFPAVFCTAYAIVLGLGAYFAGRKSVRLNPVTLVCLFSAAVMLVDLVFGGRLLIFPLLGSSVQDGMRFYGMSNAVSGMMIAYGLWGLVGLGAESISKKGRARVATFGALAVFSFCVGFGLMGGDFGGFIAAAATALVFFFSTSRTKFGGWRIFAVVAGTLVATAVVVGADALFVHTHAGHAIAAGSGQVFPLIGRKALILFSQFKSVLVLALALVASVVLLALWMKRPASFWSARWETDRTFTAALFSLLIGSIVALLLNDTGIGMMGTMMMITTPVAVYHGFGKASDECITCPRPVVKQL